MSRFKKAEESGIRLKALIYGPAGCGKTVTALQFPSPFVIDGEKGTVHYGADFNFQVDDTSSVDFLMEDINDLIEDPGDAKTLVVDPITVFMDNLLIDYSKKLKIKKGNPDYELQPSDHGPLKQRRKDLIDKMLSLDLNLVCTARIKQKYKQDGKNFMIPDGVEPDVPKEIPYMFDTIIRIEISPDGITRIAHCEKDRTNKLPKEFVFTYDAMVEYLGISSLDRAADPNKTKEILERAGGRTLSVHFMGKKVNTAGVLGSTLDRIVALMEDKSIPEPEFKAMLIDSYGYTSPLDLKEDEAQFLITTLENK